MKSEEPYQDQSLFAPLKKRLKKHLRHTRVLEKDLRQAKKIQIEQQQLLIQQSKMAAMGEMLALIAHQWRQPLSTIHSITANLKIRAELNCLTREELEKTLTEIEQQSFYLNETITDFRNFLSPTKSKKIISLQEIVKNSLKLIGKSLEQSQVEVILKLESSLPQLSSHANELIQVLLNLLKNAQDALLAKPGGNKKIWIESGEDETHQWLKVRDNAGGIPLDIIELIFTPYFTTKDAQIGTGLGLHMSRIIVTEHCQGQLDVVNDPVGACFTLRLPQKAEYREARQA